MHNVRRTWRNAFRYNHTMFNTTFFHLHPVRVHLICDATRLQAATVSFSVHFFATDMNAFDTLTHTHIWRTHSRRLPARTDDEKEEKETTNDYLESIWCFLYSISIASHFYFLSFSSPLLLLCVDITYTQLVGCLYIYYTYISKTDAFLFIKSHT